MDKKPVILLSYANDPQNLSRHLPALEKEKDILEKIFGRYEKNNDIQIQPLYSSTPKNLVTNLNIHKDDLLIFHFSGHADGTLLELESGDLTKENLANILAGEKRLKLVFLNACKTFDHVKLLHEKGVQAVIAASIPVDDHAAKDFAETFYEVFTAGNTLKEAFERAQAAIESGKPTNRIHTRDVVKKMTFVDGKTQMLKDWGLFVHDETILYWKLKDDIPQRSVYSHELPYASSDPSYFIGKDGYFPQKPVYPHELSFAPPLPSHFIGKEEQIKELNQFLTDSKQVVLVNGLGGVGKTTLAQAYYHRFKADFDHVVWTYVPHDPQHKLENSSTAKDAIASEDEIFKRLNLPFDAINTTALERIQMLFRKLQSIEGNNLFIIDNATEAIAEIRPYLPKPPHWKILVTSRQQLEPFAKFDLANLDPDDAEVLFYKYYTKTDKQQESAKKLLEHIGYHTLTIELLAKLCQNSLRLKPQDVYEIIQTQNFNTLEQKVYTARTENEVKVFSYLVGAFSIADLSSGEKYLLTQFSVLPSIGISFDLISELLVLKDSELENTDEILQSLIKKGWIKRAKDDTFSCHQIVQEVLRYQINPNATSCKKLLKGLTSLFSLDQNKDKPVDKSPYLEYGDTFLIYVTEDTPEMNVLKNNLALAHKDYGNKKKASELLESALSSDLAYFGEAHLTVSVRRSNLALVYQALKRYDRASELLESALFSDLAHFGEAHPTIAERRSNLALVYQALGSYKLAVELLETALASDLANFGETHPIVAKRRSNLGLVYKDLESYDRATELLESALALDLANFGDAHPIVAERRSNLALVYKDLRRYNRAVELLESALASNLSHFEKTHPNVAMTRSILIRLYRDLGSYERAAELLESELAAAISHFGEAHPNVAISRSELASVYQNLKSYTRAKKLLKSALEFDLAHFDEDHPNVALSRWNLGNLMMVMEDFYSAKEYFEKAFNGWAKELGKDHLQTKMAKKGLEKAIQKLTDRS